MKKPLTILGIILLLSYVAENYLMAFLIIFVMILMVLIKILRFLDTQNKKQQEGTDADSHVRVNVGQMTGDDEKFAEVMKSIRKAKREMMDQSGIVDPTLKDIPMPADDPDKVISLNDTPAAAEKKDDDVPFVFNPRTGAATSTPSAPAGAAPSSPADAASATSSAPSGAASSTPADAASATSTAPSGAAPSAPADAASATSTASAGTASSAPSGAESATSTASSGDAPSSSATAPFGSGSSFGSQDSFSGQDTFNGNDTFKAHL